MDLLQMAIEEGCGAERFVNFSQGIFGIGGEPTW